MEYVYTIGQKMKKLAKQRGLYQKDVAKILHVSRARVSQIYESVPDIEQLVKFCEALDVDFSHFFPYKFFPKSIDTIAKMKDLERINELLEEVKVLNEKIREMHEAKEPKE